MRTHLAAGTQNRPPPAPWAGVEWVAVVLTPVTMMTGLALLVTDPDSWIVGLLVMVSAPAAAVAAGVHASHEGRPSGAVAAVSGGLIGILIILVALLWMS